MVASWLTWQIHVLDFEMLNASTFKMLSGSMYVASSKCGLLMLSIFTESDVSINSRIIISYFYCIM